MRSEEIPLDGILNNIATKIEIKKYQENYI